MAISHVDFKKWPHCHVKFKKQSCRLVDFSGLDPFQTNHCSEYSSHNLHNWAGDHSTLWPTGITQKEACFPSDEHVVVKHGVILFRSSGEDFEPYV